MTRTLTQLQAYETILRILARSRLRFRVAQLQRFYDREDIANKAWLRYRKAISRTPVHAPDAFLYRVVACTVADCFRKVGPQLYAPSVEPELTETSRPGPLLSLLLKELDERSHGRASQ